MHAHAHVHTNTHTLTHSYTLHWILAQMAPSGLVIKGVMSYLWWRLCVPLPVIHFLSSCPYWHKAERKEEREERKCTFIFFSPFPTDFQPTLILPLKCPFDKWKEAKIKLATASRLFKDLISKSVDLCALMHPIYTNVIILFWEILEPLLLEGCLFLGSRDHRQFVCLSLSWQELVLFVCKGRRCRTPLWDQLYACVCLSSPVFLATWITTPF